jgi:hypothetical protein
MKEGEKHHLKGRIVHMEIVLNLCSDLEVVHKDHARRTWCAHVKDHGERTTRVAIGKRFYLLKMKEDVEHLTHICVKCQNMKSIYKKKYGLYKLLSFLNEPWESVSMDFMMQLPKWNGMDAILVVVNWFSKLAKMVPTKTTATTFDLKKLFFDMWVRHHGMPQLIINDRNTKFMVDF